MPVVRDTEKRMEGKLKGYQSSHEQWKEQTHTEPITNYKQESGEGGTEKEGGGGKIFRSSPGQKGG